MGQAFTFMEKDAGEVGRGWHIYNVQRTCGQVQGSRIGKIQRDMDQKWAYGIRYLGQHG